MNIDLNKCVDGQKLRSKHGLILEYIAPTTDPRYKSNLSTYYDHIIKYPLKGCQGTRMNDGFTYKNPDSRLPEDHDIVEILPLDYKLSKEDKEIIATWKKSLKG